MNVRKSFVIPLALSSFCFSGSAFAQAAGLAGEIAATSSEFDLVKVFQGSPIIYTTLIALSILSFIIWLYSLLTLRVSDMIPDDFISKLREEILDKRYEAALTTCQQDNNFCAVIMASGITARRHGTQVMLDVMQSEGRRCGAALWQRISLLNDIATIAPMLGLLGTVLGMFYAFYDTNRTMETITSIFDGLGVAIGTTVAGMIVAIIAMIFYTTLKFRIVTLLNTVENEVLALANIIEPDSK